MKIKITLSLLGMLFILQSCTKENCMHTFKGVTYNPVYAPMATLRSVSIEPAKPITSNGKMFIKGNYIFLNEVDKGFHIIDNTNPASPQRISFVSIPGNLDLIAKGNYLFVDNYVDLLTFDISNPSNIQLVKRTENALPSRQYNYGFADNAANGVIVSFTRKVEKMEMDCNSNGRILLDPQTTPTHRRNGRTRTIGYGHFNGLPRFRLPDVRIAARRFDYHCRQALNGENGVLLEYRAKRGHAAATSRQQSDCRHLLAGNEQRTTCAAHALRPGAH